MVIWMKQFFAGNLITSVGCDFIYIHVRLCSASCLVNNKRKIPIQLTFIYLVTYLFNN